MTERVTRQVTGRVTDGITCRDGRGGKSSSYVFGMEIDDCVSGNDDDEMGDDDDVVGMGPSHPLPRHSL